MTGAIANLRYASRHPIVLGTFIGCALAFIALCVACALVLFADSARDARRQQLNEQLRAYQERGQANELRSTFQRVSGEVARIDVKLDYAATQGQLVQDFAELAVRHQVTILNQSYEEGRRNGTLQALNTELTVRGSYRSIRGLLLDVPALRAWTEVREVLLERAREPGVVNAKIQLATFRRAERS
jgi:hypothetical protein